MPRGKSKDDRRPPGQSLFYDFPKTGWRAAAMLPACMDKMTARKRIFLIAFFMRFFLPVFSLNCKPSDLSRIIGLADRCKTGMQVTGNEFCRNVQ